MWGSLGHLGHLCYLGRLDRIYRSFWPCFTITNLRVQCTCTGLHVNNFWGKQGSVVLKKGVPDLMDKILLIYAPDADVVIVVAINTDFI